MSIPVEDVARVCICLHTRMAARAVTRAYNAAMKRTGLEVTQMSLLAALSPDDAPSIAVLAERLAFERTTLLRNLRVLVGKGLVTPIKGPGRAIRHTLTPAGRRQLAEALPLWQDIQARIEAALGERPWAETRRGLRAIRHAATTTD